VAGLAGEGVGKDEGLTHNRFVAADRRRGAGTWPAGGAQGTRPPRALFRRPLGLGRSTSGTGRL
jgi:hypothetical protein